MPDDDRSSNIHQHQAQEVRRNKSDVIKNMAGREHQEMAGTPTVIFKYHASVRHIHKESLGGQIWREDGGARLSTPRTLHIHFHFHTLERRWWWCSMPKRTAGNDITFVSRAIQMIHLLLLGALASTVIPLSILLYRIVFPTIIPFPWHVPSASSSASESDRKNEKTQTVVFAGSFNPPHWGHLVMIRYLAERYVEVTCFIYMSFMIYL